MTFIRDRWPTSGLKAMAAAVAFAASALPSLARDARQDDHIRGVVRALNRATVSTNEPLQAIEVKVRDGEYFRAGDVLVVFDCTRQQSEWGAAEAALREAELHYESARSLARYNAIGAIEVNVARQRRQRAKHELGVLNARLKDCKFTAPFDGRVAEITLRPLERTVALQAYMKIVSSGDLEIESIVSSHLLSRLRIGTRFTFKVDEFAGASLSAKVVAIGAAVDPVSKTVKVLGAFERRPEGVLPGMSGTISLQQDQ